MLSLQNIDKTGEYTQRKDEQELLNIAGIDAEKVRNFYSLTGAARKDYIIQMAEAEAERIKILRQAQAEGLLAIRRAEADGFKSIGEALAQCKYPQLVAKLAGLVALQDVAQSLGDGQATKIFLPQNLGDIFSLVAGWKEMLEKPQTGSGGTPTPPQQPVAKATAAPGK
jgi:regulator of protease activity HflC (stomatin/prohibitin superfamily)